jgi:MFS family permease
MHETHSERATSIRLTMTIFGAQSFVSASQIAILTLLAIMAVDLSGRESLTGLPATMLTTGRALTALPIGYFMGRFGRRLGLGVSYGTMGIGALLGVLAIVQGWFWLLLISSAVIGAGRAGAEQSRFVAGDLFPEHERARWIGVVVFAGTLGSVLGPFLIVPGAMLAARFGIVEDAGPWLIALIFYALATLVTFVFLYPEPMAVARRISEHEKRKNDDPAVASDESVRPVRALLRLPDVQLAIASMLISQAVMVALMTITPLHMDHNSMGKESVSIVISAHTFGMFGLSWLTGYLIDRFGRIPMMVVAAITLIISAIIAPLSATMPFLISGLFLLGLGWNFGFIAGSSLLSDALRGEERARMQGVNDMLVAAAAAVGSLTTGMFYSLGGYVTVAGVGIVVTLLFAWLIWLLAPQPTLKAA